MKKEIRVLTTSEAELRVKKEDGKPTRLVGYFAKFNKPSEDFGGYREIIEPGFFDEALKNSDVVDLFNHDDNMPLGRQSAFGKEGLLKIWEDDIGLRYELTPVQTADGEKVIKLVDTGVVKGNSFGFIRKEGGSEVREDEDGNVFVILKRSGCRELIDGSQVLFPAYPDTEVSTREYRSFKEAKTSVNADSRKRVNTLKIESLKRA